jgi:hypothetical protein
MSRGKEEVDEEEKVRLRWMKKKFLTRTSCNKLNVCSRIPLS